MRLILRSPGSVFLGLVGCGWLALIWLWEPAYLTLTVDDSFYYLQIARQVAAGNGPTFDGLNPTNGFHPLWLLVLGALARAAPLETATLMRLALSLELAMVCAAAWLLGRHSPAGSSRVPAVTAFLLLNFYFCKTLVNGMESALLFLLMAVCLALWRRPAESDAPGRDRRSAGIGLAAGLTVLARLEAVVFALPLLLLPLGTAPPEGRPRRRPAAVAVLAFALPVGAWALWSLARFGHLVPVSAAIKGQRAAVSWSAATAGALLLPLSAAVLAIWLAARAGEQADRPFRWWLLPAALFSCAVSAVILLDGYWVPPIWYLPPFALLAVQLGARWLGRRRAAAPGRWLTVAGALVLLAWGARVWQLRLDPASYSTYLAARRNGSWLAEHAPRDAIAAGWGSGIAAAHSRRTFINLDGLANSWTYKQEYLDRGRTEAFITEVHRVDYVAQFFVRGHLARTRHFRGVDLSGWSVARAECVDFRSIVRPSLTSQRIYVVLQRDRDPSLPTLDQLAGTIAQLCPPAAGR